MPQPPGRSLGTSIPVGLGSSVTDKLTGNNNAAWEWLTANNESTQRLGFGSVCVYFGVHWQWHIMPGRPSPLPIWYQPVFSQCCLCCVTPGFRGATAIHIYSLLRIRIWRAYMEDKQRIKVISAGEDLRRALGIIRIEDKSNELRPLQRSNQFIFSSSSCYDHCDPHVLTAENRAKNYSSISKSLIWAHANCQMLCLKQQCCKNHVDLFQSLEKNALKFLSLTDNANFYVKGQMCLCAKCAMQNNQSSRYYKQTVRKIGLNAWNHYAHRLNKTFWNTCVFCKSAFTCHTTGSMWSTVRESQTLNTRVWEAEVRTLAMMASRMENGSMV